MSQQAITKHLFEWNELEDQRLEAQRKISEVELRQSDILGLLKGECGVGPYDYKDRVQQMVIISREHKTGTTNYFRAPRTKRSK